MVTHSGMQSGLLYQNATRARASSPDRSVTAAAIAARSRRSGAFSHLTSRRRRRRSCRRTCSPGSTRREVSGDSQHCGSSRTGSARRVRPHRDDDRCEAIRPRVPGHRRRPERVAVPVAVHLGPEPDHGIGEAGADQVASGSAQVPTLRDDPLGHPARVFSRSTTGYRPRRGAQVGRARDALGPPAGAVSINETAVPPGGSCSGSASASRNRGDCIASRRIAAERGKAEIA